MKYRKLGRTDLYVSAIGVGTEHLNGKPRETVVAVIREAIERGVNYFDLIFPFPDYLDNMRVAFEGCRDHVVLTAHLGSTEKNGQYFKSRSVRRCETFFLDFLSRLGTDYTDVLMLHNCNSQKDYDNLFKSDGVVELALRLKQEGKARFIGFSGHTVSTALQAVESGHVDVLMFPINLTGNAMPDRKRLLNRCVELDVGVVAMKPFVGGKLLREKGMVRVPKYATGGQAYKTRLPDGITPARCLSYVLAQIGISLALPGVINTTQLSEALHTLEATDAERDFSAVLAGLGQYLEGECVYCNHCLPCPVVIDIGQVLRLLDEAKLGLNSAVRAAYDALAVRASACTECGACAERCPFGVDVVPKMHEAVVYFEAAQ